jgi:hypothetical protein
VSNYLFSDIAGRRRATVDTAINASTRPGGSGTGEELIDFADTNHYCVLGHSFPSQGNRSFRRTSVRVAGSARFAGASPSGNFLDTARPPCMLYAYVLSCAIAAVCLLDEAANVAQFARINAGGDTDFGAEFLTL